MTVIIEMAGEGTGDTIYMATARHRSREARERHEAMGFFDGWGVVVDHLAECAKAFCSK